MMILGMGEQWPESHKKLLIPAMLLPIPDCDKNVVTPNYLPGTCNAMNPGSTLEPVTANPGEHGRHEV